MKAVLFDFDYTLADSSETIVACLSYALNSAKLPVPAKNLMLSTIGMSLTDTFAILAPDFPPQKLIDSFRVQADQIMVNGTKLYKPVCSVIKELKKQGYLLGIISTKFRFRIETILEREQLLSFFDIIIGGEDVAKHKPDPEGLLKAINILHCTQESVTYVGDSIVDAHTALAAGVDFIGVATGATPKEELLKLGASNVVDDLDELLTFLNSAPTVA